MLRSLAIRDFVLVDCLELDFDRGFTVLTGETGAGKSILIDALALLLGERADAGVVREGAGRADLSATLDIANLPELKAWLGENDFSGDDLDCVLRRVIDVSGRGKAYINGAPATIQQLRNIGEFAVDILGQHAHQALLRNGFQRDLLDAYGGARDLVADVAAAYRRWQELRRAKEEIEHNAEALGRERELLEWQVKELSALHLSEDEWQSLSAEFNRLSHAASLLETVQSASDALNDSDDAMIGRLTTVRTALLDKETIDPSLEEFRSLIDSALIELSEAAQGLRRYLAHTDVDPERLSEVEARFAAIHAMARKYRCTPEALPAELQKITARVDALSVELDPAALAAQEAEAAQQYARCAKALTKIRTASAARLAQEVTRLMHQLAMPTGRFDIGLNRNPSPSAAGDEHVEYLLAPHESSPLKPLAKSASGGELSRIALAIQVATRDVAAVPTLIFDEVDVGIGGRVAESVGTLLRQLATHRQVFCITHLPQVAVLATHHLRVVKREAPGSVTSTVQVLDGAARVEEIARMLGGTEITETTRAHAREMLEAGANAG